MSRAMIVPCELRKLAMYARSFLSCGSEFRTFAIFLWAGVARGLFFDVFVLSCD